MPEARQSQSAAEGLQTVPLRASYTANPAVMEQHAIAANPWSTCRGSPGLPRRRGKSTTRHPSQKRDAVFNARRFLRCCDGAAVHACDLQ